MYISDELRCNSRESLEIQKSWWKNGKQNGFEFKLEDIVAEPDEERSRERTEETDIKTAVVEFHVNVAQIENEERFNYELKGNIEYDADGAEAEFDDGSQYRSYLTLLAGDILDAEFNGAIKDYCRRLWLQWLDLRWTWWRNNKQNRWND